MMVSSGLGHRLRHALGGSQRSGGHDVEVASVGRQVMGGAFDFEEDRGFQPAQVAEARDVQRLVLRDHVKLDLLLQAVTRYVADRKSTRLNSSHVKISYAVCCSKTKEHDPH